MLILPERGPIWQRKSLLVPVPRKEFKPASQRRTLYGIENGHYAIITAKLPGGMIWWRGYFDDFEDADEFFYRLQRFCWAGEKIPRDVRRLAQRESLPHTAIFEQHNWFPARYRGEWIEDYGELPLTYQFSAATALTSPTGSNQTWTAESDFTAVNAVIVIGGGASGGAGSNHCTGGGGGACNFIVNVTGITAGSTTKTYQLGASVTGSVGADGTDGNSSWWGNTTFNTSSVGAVGGTHGVQNTGSVNGGAGGVGTSGRWYGAAGGAFSGGRGGNLTGGSGSGGSGGGGAAGPYGAGAAGSDDASTTSNVQTSGGQGDNGTGGAGGGPTSNGSAGTEVDVSDSATGLGTGGGGGGKASTSGTISAGNGGNYGGGGGGCRGGGTPTGGTGAQGAILVIRAPSTSGVVSNIPALGRGLH